MEQIFVKPVNNIQVLHPRTGEYIKQEGEWVPNVLYFKRKILLGELDIAQPPKPAKNTPKQEEKEDK